MTVDDAIPGNSGATSNVWRDLVADAGSPGFSLRTTYPTNPNGVEVMLEHWEAGTEEPPHSHPGDDMTIVVEGRMSTSAIDVTEIHWLLRERESFSVRADVGYTSAGRIHDGKYTEDCQLVYVHNGAFAFLPADLDIG